MQNMGWKLLLILVILGLCGSAIWLKEPRLGKDLRGGTSLTYSVRIDPDEVNPQEVLKEIIEVLKQRVNPKGVFDISMEPLGRDRIEVIMPLPGQDVRDLKTAFDAALETLLTESEIPVTALDTAITNGTLGMTFDVAAGGARGEAIAALELAATARGEAEVAYQAITVDAEDSVRNMAMQRVARANSAFKRARQAVLDLSLPAGAVKRTLALPTHTKRSVDADTGEETQLPSDRDLQLTALEGRFPSLTDDLAVVVEAFDAYQSKRRGLDDPEDLKRLLRGAGVLEFHIAVRNAAPGTVDIVALRDELDELGPENTSSTEARWMPIDQLKQWYNDDKDFIALEADPVAYFAGGRDLVAARSNGQYFLLVYTTGIRSLVHDGDHEWKLKGAMRSADSLGRPSVAFELDLPGATAMSRLTGGNLQEPMAIVLDGAVFSAPTIQSTISSNGQITGSFTPSEISYLIRVLNAGSLSARLSPEPISMNTLGPTLGADNLDRGSEAFMLAIAAVIVFMLVYYFFAGLVANLALVANGIIIFGVMIAIDGTFTLPGLAGIVLTVGMAVDANVLIYERIREEIFAGELDLKGCIRQGYGKALSTILDGNITNLIVCFVLFYVATTEIKGFALTLTIGICATLFTALFLTRQIYYLYTDVFGIKKLNMLPIAIPSIHRFLEPNLNWVGMRKGFWTMSAIAMVISAALVVTSGVEMLDTEFRGGVSATMATRITAPATDPKSKPTRLMLTQDEVTSQVLALAEGIEDPETATSADEKLRRLAMRSFLSASVQTVGDTEATTGGISSSEFQIKVSNPKGLEENQTITRVIMNALIESFGEDLDVAPSLSFPAMHGDSTGFAYPIEKDDLADAVDRTDITHRVPAFRGGLALMINGVVPAVSDADVTSRIERMRGQPDFTDISSRTFKVFGLNASEDGSGTFSDFVIVVKDDHRSSLKMDPDAWYRDVVAPEWTLITAALTQPASLQNVSEYSSAVAETLKANAIVAVTLTLLGILVYIWVRFGSLRYSAAAIVALVHDVTIALGLLALSTLIGGTTIGDALLIEPFRINLGVVAALLTIIGYSLNDTIVILDRIRENRGKLPLPTAAIVNRSVNQTVSRTLLTSFTTIMAVMIMYVEGGSGIRPFAFCLLVGLFVGTYSSVAIAAPLVFSHKATGTKPASRGMVKVPDSAGDVVK